MQSDSSGGGKRAGSQWSFHARSGIDLGFFALALCIINGVGSEISLRYMGCFPRYGSYSKPPIDKVTGNNRNKNKRIPRSEMRVEIFRYLRENPQKGVRGCTDALRVSSSTVVKLLKEYRASMKVPEDGISEDDRKILEHIQAHPLKRLEVVAFDLGFPRSKVLETFYQNLD